MIYILKPSRHSCRKERQKYRVVRDRKFPEDSQGFHVLSLNDVHKFHEHGT